MNDHKEWEKEMSSNFNGMMDGIRSKPVPSDSLERSLRAAEAIVMTKSAYKRGYLNAMIGMIIIWPIFFLTAAAASKIFDVDRIFAMLGVSAGFFAIAFLVMMGQMALGRVRRGKVLLDCGPFPARKYAWMMAALTFTAAFITALVTTGMFGKVIAIFLAVFALYWVFLSRGRLQICENGVFQYWSLLRWDQIKSYRWEGDTDATLMIQSIKRFGMQGRGALPVAIEQKKAVDALLQKHHTKKQ